MIRQEEIKQAAEDYYNEVKYLSDLSAFPIAAFKAGAEWADETMIDRVCEWLKENMCFTTGIANGIVGYQCAAMECFINDLRKAMEEKVMITQEEIGYTKEEISAMMKTIQELRKEKKEWIEKAFEFFNKKLYLYREYEEDLDGVGRTFEFLTCDYDTTDEFNEAFKKHMEQ